MKVILVATDFSSTALNAAEYGAQIALTINATLLLLHVYQLPIAYPEVPPVVTEEELRQDAEKQLAALKSWLIQKTDEKLNIKTEIKAGIFFHELQTTCEDMKPYIVVMGSQGKGAIERFFLGSQTIHAMRDLMWPLVTVPPKYTGSSIKKIGLACDFDHIDTIPMDEIKMFVNDFNASLHILNVGKKNAFNPEIVFKSTLLEKMLDSLKFNYHFITHENVEEGIISFSEKNHIDLLIVLPREYDFFDRLIHKSHAKQLVLHSSGPIMTLHTYKELY